VSGRLEYVGYKPHRPGRIHLFCPRCKRKMSNMPRQAMDPPTAVLVHVFCESCSQGGKDSSQTFLDSTGRELCCFCGRRGCEIVGGTRRCDERLIGGVE
jgi:hypothetical protein